jgi:hypothetical protein
MDLLMITKTNFIRVSLLVAGGLAVSAFASQAQSAAAKISWVAAAGSYNYTITLQNTGSYDLNGFWYGWTSAGDNLASVPSSPGNAPGWGNNLSGHSIKWMNNSYTYDGYTYYYGTPLAPGASTTFTFVSSSPPSAIAAQPSSESVAYVGSIDSSQGVRADSTGAFSPTLVNPPAPMLGATMNTAGSVAATSNAIVLSWPTNSAGFILQSTTNLLGAAAWVPVSPAPVVVNGQYTATNIIAGAQQFFRLATP